MASLPVKIATAVDADKLAVGEIVVNSTNGEVWTKTSVGEVKKVGAGSGDGGYTAWADITGKPAVIGAGSTITNAQAAMGIIVSATAPVSPAEGTIWIKA